MKKIFVALSTVLLVVTGCASTQIKASWKDPAYSVHSMHKALVMAVVPESTSQRVLEDAFVEKIAQHGTQAVASYSLSPAEAKLNEEGWKRLVASNGIDAVLVVRLVDVKTVEREVPPTTYTQGSVTPPGMYPGYNNWYGYYQNGYQVVTTPGYTVHDTVAVVESKLWNVSNGKMVWTGSTHTQVYPDQNTESLLRQYANIIVRAIYK